MTAGTLEIATRKVGPGHPCFVIAEAGVNHDGDPALAHQLVDVAAECGADAVKFQTFDPVSLVAAKAPAAPYQRRTGAAAQRRLLDRLTLPASIWPDLAAHAGERGLLFLSTAFDLASLDLLLAAGMAAIKVPSGELDNLAFIAALAAHRLPMVVSTGLGTLDEVAAAVDAAAEAPGLALLHCVTAYPSPVEASNLRAMTTMRDAFGLPVGWSDHTEGSVTAVAAVALSASILEKHLTTDRKRPGPDHAASADPEGFATYVAAVRAAESSLGDGVKRPQPAEDENRVHARRSFHTTRELEAGETIGEADVRLLRPATGLPPAAKVVGRIVARRVEAGRALVAEDLR